MTPEALHNIAHIAFPQDRLVGQILKIQKDKYGLPPGLHCSSLIGPKCASFDAFPSKGDKQFPPYSKFSTDDKIKTPVTFVLQSQDISSDLPNFKVMRCAKFFEYPETARAKNSDFT